MIWQLITVDVFYSIFFLCHFVDSYLFMQSVMPYLSPDWTSTLCFCLYELTEKGPSQITSVVWHGAFAAWALCSQPPETRSHPLVSGVFPVSCWKCSISKSCLDFGNSLQPSLLAFPLSFHLGKLEGKITNGDHIFGCLAMSCKCKQLPSSQTAILWLQGNATAVLWAQVVRSFILCQGNFEWLMNKWSVSKKYLHLHIWKCLNWNLTK